MLFLFFTCSVFLILFHWIQSFGLFQHVFLTPETLGKFPTQFSSVQSLSRVWLFATPWTTACQTSLSITNSQSLLKLISIESMMPSNHLLLCHSLLLLPSIFLSIRVSSNELALHIKWPKYWSFSFSISPFNDYSGLYIKPVHSERDQPWMWAWALPLVSCVMVGKWLNLYEISSHISSINTGNNKSYIVGLLFVVSKLNLINGLA